jgi:hypothetical protein
MELPFANDEASSGTEASNNISCLNLSFNLDITPPQWDAIKQLIDVLDVFKRATFVTSGSAVTVSEVISLVNSSINFLETKKFSHGNLQGFVNDLLFSIESLFEFLEKEQLFTFATILDPRFKISVFQDSNNIEIIKKSIGFGDGRSVRTKSTNKNRSRWKRATKNS